MELPGALKLSNEYFGHKPAPQLRKLAVHFYGRDGAAGRAEQRGA